MTFDSTRGVRTAEWHPQARRAPEPVRETASRTSRFDSLVSASASARSEAAVRQADLQKDRSDARKADANAASSTDRRDPPSKDKTTTRPAAKDDPAPRARKSDDDADAKAGQDAPAAAAADAPADKTAKAGKASDETVQTGESQSQTAGPAATGLPILVPITTTSAQTAPQTGGDAQLKAGSGQAAAVQGSAALTAAKIAALPGTAIGSGDHDDTAPTDGKPADASGFLAALSDGGQGSKAPDAPASATPSAATAVSQASGSTTTTATPTAQAAVPTAPPVPMGQVPMTIGLRSLAGSSEFQIRLDPAELGRIDVKLEIDKRSGSVATHLVVDRPETLAMLQRDAGQLQQALTQAGLDPSASGINLSLRGDGGNAAGGQTGGQQGGNGQPNLPWTADRADTDSQAGPMQMLRGYGGLDIRI